MSDFEAEVLFKGQNLIFLVKIRFWGQILISRSNFDFEVKIWILGRVKRFLGQLIIIWVIFDSKLFFMTKKFNIISKTTYSIENDTQIGF